MEGCQFYAMDGVFDMVIGDAGFECLYGKAIVWIFDINVCNSESLNVRFNMLDLVLLIF